MKTYAGYHRRTGPWQPTAALQRVLDGVAVGDSNRAIAERLGLSPETVKAHIATLLAETGCTDRTELAAWWQAQATAPAASRRRTLALVLALAAIAAVGMAVIGGVLVLVLAPGRARSRAPGARPAAAKQVPPATAPAETAPTPPPATPTPRPQDLPDPASSPTGTGPVVFLWATPTGKLVEPQALAVDAQGNVYVVDSGHDRIVKFDPNGNVLTSWGSHGSGDGQFVFQHPPGFTSGIAVDAQDVVYVLDDSARLQRFDSIGRFLGRWPGGGHGEGPGQFVWPAGIAIDHAGRLYVADCGVNSPATNRIQQFSADGTLLASWGTKGTGAGEFDCPTGHAVDAAGNLYVSDRYNHRVQVLDSGGRPVGLWGRLGMGPGQFNHPAGVAVDAHGDVYVADNYNHRVEKFDGQGTYLGEWGSYGWGDGRFDYPAGIAIDVHGDIYISDVLNGRIEKFRPR